MSASQIQLISIQYENVRGFYNATLPLEKKKTLIVGRNHAGKTSAFLLLSWLINDADADRLYAEDYLTPQEQELLLPARTAQHRARRITLIVHIPDGRVAGRFKADKNNHAILRVGFRVSGPPYAFIQLGKAKRNSGDESDARAMDLLNRIQDIFSVVHIPSARDATSQQFQERFRNLYKDKLADRALHPGKQSGSTTEYRAVVQATTSLKKLTKSLLDPMLDDLAKSLPMGMMESPSLTFKDNTEQSIVDWIVDQVGLKLVTGEHDNVGVSPSDVGAGLQSVLDIAAASVILSENKKQLIVAVEEPEAFLHPSLQRIIARILLSTNYGNKTLVSTHSPILVEEAKYEDILLAVDRNFLVPKKENESKRSNIHTALLRGQGAEMIFASSVLLVEGEGDQAFFEGLRRRIARLDSKGLVENLFVIPVGGKNIFSPWIKLIHALNGGSSKGAINYLVAPDGDATSELQQAFNENNISFPISVHTTLQEARKNFAENNFIGWRSELNRANAMLFKSTPLCFLEGDLEFAIFSGATENQCKYWSNVLGVSFGNKNSFIKRMGSKAIDGSGGDKYKAPYMRRLIAEKIPFSSLSESLKITLVKWIMNVGINEKTTKKLIDNVK